LQKKTVKPLKAFSRARKRTFGSRPQDNSLVGTRKSSDSLDLSVASAGIGTVPEPSIWVMLVVGFLGLGELASRQRHRRRRRRSTTRSTSMSKRTLTSQAPQAS
jgi:hypothetical protein